MTLASSTCETGTLEAVYLHPAQICFCSTPSRVETVLGSCVSVTMWNPRLQIASICHAVLPLRGHQNDEPRKYVDSSVRQMLEFLHLRGSLRQEIEIKLFGGAAMSSGTQGRASVGQQNVAAALAVLEQEGYAPVVSDTGGTQGRKLRFYSSTGEVFVKRIQLKAGE